MLEIQVISFLTGKILEIYAVAYDTDEAITICSQINRSSYSEIVWFNIVKRGA
jgi:hypothetical protein